MSAFGLNLVDIGVIAVLVVSGLLAFGRGFVREMLSIGAWVAAAIATVYGFPMLQPVMRQRIDVALIADAVTAVAIFIVTLIVVTAVSSVLTRNLRGSAFGPIDRSLGLLFGLARGAVLVCLAYLMLTWLTTPDDRPAWLNGARSLPLIVAGAGLIRNMLPSTAIAQGSAAAAATRQRVEQAVDAGRTAQGLVQPEPAKPGSAANTAGAPGGSGYKEEERRDLDRLIHGTQQ